MTNKDQGALLTIGEVAEQLGLPTHILRYWETRFSALKPLTRAGGRRYYRPDDVALIHRINTLLNVKGFTIKGAEKALASGADEAQLDLVAEPPVAAAASDVLPGLQRIRDRLARALAESQV